MRRIETALALLAVLWPCANAGNAVRLEMKQPFDDNGTVIPAFVSVFRLPMACQPLFPDTPGFSRLFPDGENLAATCSASTVFQAKDGDTPGECNEDEEPYAFFRGDGITWPLIDCVTASAALDQVSVGAATIGAGFVLLWLGVLD